MSSLGLSTFRVCEDCGVAVFDGEPAPHACDPKIVEVSQIVQATVELMRFNEQLAEYLDSAEGERKVLVAHYDRKFDELGKDKR